MITIALVVAVVSVNCDNDRNNDPIARLDFSGTFSQQDQMGRPAINTVFVALGQPKDDFYRCTHRQWVPNTKPIFST
jgi:hypothetical protein